MKRNRIALITVLIGSTLAFSILVLFLYNDNKIFSVEIPTQGYTVPNPNSVVNTSQPEPIGKLPINIVDILTIISLTVTIAYGILKLLGKTLYIGSRKKPPYVIILKKLRQTIHME